MDTVIFTKTQARKIVLDAACLTRKAQLGTGIEAVYRFIDHLGFVQLDTNYVVERAHHHVIATRVPDYKIEWLNELCEEGQLFEYFASDAGYLPMNDFRYSLPVKNAFKTQNKPLNQAEINLMKEMMDCVERDGPVKVTDFENDRTEASSGWWDWRPAKVALERLYFNGDLMVRRTPTFQKMYDLPLNLVPDEITLTMPTEEEYARYIIERTLGALGIASVREMVWRSRRVKGNLVKKTLDAMVSTGEVKKVNVEGVKGPLYMLRGQHIDIKIENEVFILSPFDILNVFRHRLKDFFDFEYQIECFVPAPKRLYGYFSLPILAGETFIARMDAKADRKQKMLIIHNIHFEPVSLAQHTLEKFVEALKSFVLFNQCHDITFSRTNNATYLETIRKEFSG